jgi:hypothetical protein
MLLFCVVTKAGDGRFSLPREWPAEQQIRHVETAIRRTKPTAVDSSVELDLGFVVRAIL